MATDTPRGGFSFGSDFVVTAIGDLPEIDIQSATGVSTAIVAKHGGHVDIPTGNSNDDDVAAVSLGALVFEVDESDLWMETRIESSAPTDVKIFVGFGDSLASADETSFSRTTGTATIDTMTDAVGFIIDGDDTTMQWAAVAGASDAVTVDQALGTTYNPVAGTPQTFRVFIAKGGRAIQWSINGKEVHRVYRDEDSAVLVGATAALVPGVWAYEQAVANTISMDYLFGGGNRCA